MCITGSTLGVALVNWDLKSFNWRILGWIVAGWIITVPVVGTLAGCLMGIIINGEYLLLFSSRRTSRLTSSPFPIVLYSPSLELRRTTSLLLVFICTSLSSLIWVPLKNAHRRSSLMASFRSVFSFVTHHPTLATLVPLCLSHAIETLSRIFASCSKVDLYPPRSRRVLMIDAPLHTLPPLATCPRKTNIEEGSRSP